MNDTECPYCGEDQEIRTDDGYGLNENETYQQQCGDCGKTFTFTTTITISHEASKAPCLNGAPHSLKPIQSIPEAFAVGKARCEWCDEEITVDEAASKAAIAAYFADTQQHTGRRIEDV